MASPNTKRTNNDEEHDLYRTDPLAVIAAINEGIFEGLSTVYDPCDGLGAITNELERVGIKCYRSDICDYNNSGIAQVNFLDRHLTNSVLPEYDAIVFNPPYKLTKEFLDQALSLTDKVVMFNRLSFLETVTRATKLKTGDWPLTDIYLFAYRVGCAKGMSDKYDTAVVYAWYVFDKQERSERDAVEFHWITEKPTKEDS